MKIFSDTSSIPCLLSAVVEKSPKCKLCAMSFKANFPIECLEDIFRHLNGKDLLKCTMVCPDWNEFVKTTPSCMEKIRLDLEHFSDFTKTVQEDEQKLKETRWMHVSARNFAPKTDDDFRVFLRLFQSTVKVLKLRVAWMHRDWRGFDIDAVI